MIVDCYRYDLGKYQVSIVHWPEILYNRLSHFFKWIVIESYAI